MCNCCAPLIASFLKGLFLMMINDFFKELIAIQIVQRPNSCSEVNAGNPLMVSTDF